MIFYILTRVWVNITIWFYYSIWQSLLDGSVKIVSYKLLKEFQVVLRQRRENIEDVRMRTNRCRLRKVIFRTSPTGNQTQGLWLNVPVLWLLSYWDTVSLVRIVRHFRIYLMIHVNGRYLIHQNSDKVKSLVIFIIFLDFLSSLSSLLMKYFRYINHVFFYITNIILNFRPVYAWVTEYVINFFCPRFFYTRPPFWQEVVFVFCL